MDGRVRPFEGCSISVPTAPAVREQTYKQTEGGVTMCDKVRCSSPASPGPYRQRDHQQLTGQLNRPTSGYTASYDEAG